MKLNEKIIKDWVDAMGWTTVRHGELKNESDYRDFINLCREVNELCKKYGWEWYDKEDRFVIENKKEVGMQKDKGPMIQLMAVWVYADPKFLLNEDMLRDLIKELIVKLDMTVLVPTIGVRVPTTNYMDTVSGRQPIGSDQGLTMFTVISESHLAIHTWPQFQKAWVEVVSCKRFDEATVENVLYKYFPGCELKSWRQNESGDLLSL
jgi:S-adenosylmethionine/arginine decarboxylase-like enzyme